MYIERQIKEKFEKIANAISIIALVGARQAGKTTFLKEQAKEKNSSYLLFDDPDVKELFEEDIKKFENQYIEGRNVSILDEVQYCKDSGGKLKYLADIGRKLWITSSSEILLSKEVLSYLVGRVSIMRLYPFSLNEFMMSKKQKEFTAKILKRNISEHAIYGGYPKVVTTQDFEIKKTILKGLYETMILKDISRTFSINDLNALENVVRYISHGIGGTFNYEQASKKINISFQTLVRYINAMEKSYLIKRIQPFYTNKFKEIVKQPKIFFIDTGLRNIISNEFNLDGQLFENYVVSELIKLGFSPKYWRTKSKAEVDFVIEKEKEIIPIEVKLTSHKIPKGLRSFIDTYKPKRAFVITLDGEKSKTKIKKCNVIFTDVHEMEKLLKE
ncbi:MAG: ATP-binding protein [Nanoarchaeota archaeon]|nr:ATP-binding protein [Nanoarchaeota archaeon]MBU1103066.1 ATP-binding protein [Nanoarchaeota archaeon]